jgi:hypothetical protein
MSADLTSLDYAFMILLRKADRELSNTEMDQLYQVRLVGSAYAKLNADGYVNSNTTARPYRHQLTAKGREELAVYLSPEGGKGRKPADKAVWAAMVSLAGATTGEAAASAPAAVPEPPVALEERIRAVYAELAAGRGDWIDLTVLRPKLADVPKADLDRALVTLLQAPDVRIEPESHGRRIDQAGREAALLVGGEARHKLAIGQR